MVTCADKQTDWLLLIGFCFVFLTFDLLQFLILSSKETTTGVLNKKVSLSLRTPTQVFTCEYYEIFKNTYFDEQLRRTASWDPRSMG